MKTAEVPLPSERYAALALTPPQQKQQTLDALVTWLTAEAERQPVLVAWEDLHWADPTTLEATASDGKVTIAVRNRDLFWHTFTVDALKLDLKVPVGRLRTATVDARPGTYRFYCRIPGHTSLGMRGTLTVR